MGCLVDERRFFGGLSTKRAVWWMRGDFSRAYPPNRLFGGRRSEFDVKVH